jgi:hypothetical protein
LATTFPIDGKDDVRANNGADGASCTGMVAFVEENRTIAAGIVSGAQLQHSLWARLHTEPAAFAAIAVNEDCASCHSIPPFVVEEEAMRVCQ